MTVSSNVAVPLPALPSVEATCVTPRSATVRTVAQDCAALSAASGSAVVEATTASLHSCDPSPAALASRTVRPIWPEEPDASEVLLQVTATGPAVPTAGALQLQPVAGVTLRKLVPAGMVSTIDTDLASLGPRFVAVSV